MRRLAPLAIAILVLASGGCQRHPAKTPAAAPAKTPAAPPAKTPAAAPAKTSAAAPGKTAPGVNPAAPPKPWPKGEPRIDAPVKDFTLEDPRGRAHDLFGAMGRQGVVVVFLSTRCPYSTAYDAVLRHLYRTYHRRGVGFLGVDPNGNESPKAIAAWRRRIHLPFPVLVDARGKVAKALGAHSTPDSYLIGKDHMLRYHGAIGNALNPTTYPKRAAPTALEPAIKDHLAGRRPGNPIIHTFGCRILH